MGDDQISRAFGALADPTRRDDPATSRREAFKLMAAWIGQYRRQAEERFHRLEAVLAEMDDRTTDPIATTDVEGAPS